MENEYNPSSVSAPGETLKDILEERGITQSQLSNQDKDLSIIAKKYGGGGHAGACGFELPLAQALEIIR